MVEIHLSYITDQQDGELLSSLWRFKDFRVGLKTPHTLEFTFWSVMIHGREANLLHICIAYISIAVCALFWEEHQWFSKVEVSTLGRYHFPKEPRYLHSHDWPGRINHVSFDLHNVHVYHIIYIVMCYVSSLQTRRSGKYYVARL